jgi:aspartate/methionine/tyrosine aminotransferase
MTAFEPPLARLSEGLEESIICEMSRLAEARQALNLAEGLPDYMPADWVLKAYQQVLSQGVALHQTTNTWGHHSIREAVSAYYRRFYGLNYSADSEITITCGASEALLLSLKAMLNFGDEIILFEPFYEPYHDLVKSLDLTPVFYALEAPDFKIDEDTLRRLISPKTKAILVNNPNNPTGRVLTTEELQAIATVAQESNLWCLSDEVYDQLLYDGRRFTPLASLSGMRERTITLGSCSKLLSATGWRVGWVVAVPRMTNALRSLHDICTAGTNPLFQLAAANALNQMTPEHLDALRAMYHRKRDLAFELLGAMGLSDEEAKRYLPEGAYYIWLDLEKAFGIDNDTAWVMQIIESAGVSFVPGLCFMRGKQTSFVRICFAKQASTLREAIERLKLASLLV